MVRNSNPWSPWLSQHVPGVFAHPDAPEGGIGLGFSREVGPSGTDLYGGGTQDPYSMDGREISSQQAAANYALYEVERSIAELSEARSTEALAKVIEAAFGSKSFSEGLCQAQRNAPEGKRFLELQRQFAQAELYDHLTSRVSWLLGLGFGFQPPALWQVARWLPYAGFGSMACSARLKKPADDRDALLKELTALFTEGDGALAPVKAQLTPQTQEHWARYAELAKRNGILSRGESGWFLGKVIVEVLPLIATLSKAAGFAAKLKGIAPQLMQFGMGLSESGATSGAFASDGQEATQKVEVVHSKNEVGALSAEEPKSFEPITGDAPLGLPRKSISESGWPDLPANDAPNFNNAEPRLLPEGTKLYRILGPTSNPAGSYWTTELPSGISEWRNSYAVLEDWNSNGQYVEAVVGKGGLKVWSGETAAQNIGNGTYYGGGAGQIWQPSNSIATSDPISTGW